MKHKLLMLIAGCLASVINVGAQATIISGTVTGGSAQSAGGVFVELTAPLSNPYGAPNSVGQDNFESPNLFAFNEDQNIILSGPLNADILAGAPLQAGDTVASHYIFFDPATPLTVTGTVVFDAPVLAVITSRGNLFNSDFLANTGVNYINTYNRGLEVMDSVTISGLNEVTFNLNALTPGDYIRVITAYSPGAGWLSIPATWTLLLVGLLGLIVRDRVRRCAV